MHHQTRPYWIIDSVSLEVLGRAHTTCRYKLSPYEHLFTSRAAGEAPSKEVIAFTKKMIDVREGLPRWETDKDFKVMLLLVSYKFEVSNVDELLNLPEVKKQFEWWGSPQGHYYTKEDLDDIKNRIRELLK